ncbi:MAG: GntR family transcriptional regulator [Clostridium sp.]|nr:GntR family transcriptional regulator [Clostridium sp.]
MINSKQAASNLTQSIYQHLWHEVSYLHLMPGKKLSEVKLAQEFQCSRIPVREAIHLLVAEDALEVRPQRGSFVTLINLEQLAQIRYLREALEYKVMMDGFRAGSLNSVVPLMEYLVSQQKDALLKQDYESAFQLDIEFHNLFYALTGKEFVLEHTGEKNIHYLRARLLSLQIEPPGLMAQQHFAIINAVKEQDESAFEKAIYVHLSNVNCLFSQEHPQLKDYIRNSSDGVSS